MSTMDDWGPFDPRLTPAERNARLADFADAIGPANSLGLRRVAFWIKVAKIDWCVESEAGLRRTIRELPTRTCKHIIARYQRKVMVDAAQAKAKAVAA